MRGKYALIAGAGLVIIAGATAAHANDKGATPGSDVESYLASLAGDDGVCYKNDAAFGFVDGASVILTDDGWDVLVVMSASEKVEYSSPAKNTTGYTVAGGVDYWIVCGPAATSPTKTPAQESGSADGDLCPNIDGVQGTVPVQLILDDAGECVPLELEAVL